MLRMMGYVYRDEETLCGNNDIFSIFVEWYEHDLDLEIKERIPRK